MASSRLSVLSNLQDYAKTREGANESLKASLWQITKLRRKQNRGMLTMEETFSAEQVREELRARTLVRNKNEDPNLVNEGSTPSLDSTTPEWGLVDAVEAITEDKENPGVGSSTIASSSAETKGLRQRKNKTVETSGGGTTTGKNSSKMTKEPIQDEEELLLQRDPLELFSGMRPGDLRMAQKNAKEALDSYIRAANQAAQILAQVDGATKK